MWRKRGYPAKKQTEEDRSNVKRAYGRVLWFLAKRDYAVSELRTKLAPYFNSETTETAINMADEHGYIKPPEELAAIIAKGLHRKEKGHRFIANKLRNLGLPVVDEDIDMEIQKAAALVSKKYQVLDFETKQKAYRFLTQRGFKYDVIKRVINEEQ